VRYQRRIGVAVGLLRTPVRRGTSRCPSGPTRAPRYARRQTHVRACSMGCQRRYNGFCVLRVKARGKRDFITVIGHAATISAGEFIQASGDWINDRTHGVQFRARFLKALPAYDDRSRNTSAPG
jgi:hypothetical protein